MKGDIKDLDKRLDLGLFAFTQEEKVKVKNDNNHFFYRARSLVRLVEL